MRVQNCDYWLIRSFRMCEAISDLFQGLFQRHERLDIAGKSMTIRYSFQHDSLLAFCLLQSH